MKNGVIIQRILAFVLLLIFTFSITPKKYLHDLVADHSDYYGFAHGNETTVSKAGFKCPTDDLVVSTPFIKSSAEQTSNQQNHHPELAPSPYSFYFFSVSTAEDLRGPPRVA